MTEQSDHQAEHSDPTPWAEPKAPLPTPWPEFTEAADLVFRHKVGLIAGHGTREADIGRDIALHTVAHGITTLLYTQHPPAERPAHLVVDQIPHPTPEHIKDRMKYPVRGQRPELVVIDRYERLRPEERHVPEQYDPIDDLDYVPLTDGQQLLWSVRDIHIDVPLLLTTTVWTEPDVSQPLDQWLNHDHPAVVLTEICKPVILLHRTDSQTVEGRVEMSPSAPGGHRIPMQWPAPETP